MKKLLFIIISFIVLNISAQDWEFEAGGSTFDGEYKTAYVSGTGTEYPYNKPTLTINKFDGKSDINFYITGSGYYQENTQARIIWIIDNEPDVIYSSIFSISKDGKTLFFSSFEEDKTGKKISDYEFIDKFKNASMASVRASDKFGKNDLSFSLKNCAKAIDYVIPKNEMNAQIQISKDARKIEAKILDLLSKYNTGLPYQTANLKRLIYESILKKSSPSRGPSPDWNMSQIKDIKMKFENQYGQVGRASSTLHLEDGRKISISNIYFSGIYQLKITKKQVKAMGGKMGREF